MRNPLGSHFVVSHLSQCSLEFHGLGAALMLLFVHRWWKREWERLVRGNNHALTLAGLGCSSLDEVLKEKTDPSWIRELEQFKHMKLL